MEESFCLCRRVETRKVALAREMGYHCPRCKRQLKPEGVDNLTPKENGPNDNTRREYTEEEILDPAILSRQSAQRGGKDHTTPTRVGHTVPNEDTANSETRIHRQDQTMIKTEATETPRNLEITPRFTPPPTLNWENEDTNNTHQQIDYETDSDSFDTDSHVYEEYIPSPDKDEYENVHDLQDRLDKLRTFSPKTEVHTHKNNAPTKTENSSKFDEFIRRNRQTDEALRVRQIVENITPGITKAHEQITPDGRNSDHSHTGTNFFYKKPQVGQLFRDVMDELNDSLKTQNLKHHRTESKPKQKSRKTQTPKTTKERTTIVPITVKKATHTTSSHHQPHEEDRHTLLIKGNYHPSETQLADQMTDDTWLPRRQEPSQQSGGQQVSLIHNRPNLDMGPAKILKQFKEKYTGENGNIFSFINRFEKFCDSQLYTDAQKCEHIDVLLDGEAFDAYYNMSSKTREDWKSLKRGLLTVFGPARLQPGDCYGQLFKLQKEEGMSVQSYYNLICRKSNQIPNASEELKTEIFTNGLPEYIRFSLKINRPTSLEDA